MNLGAVVGHWSLAKEGRREAPFFFGGVFSGSVEPPASRPLSFPIRYAVPHFLFQKSFQIPPGQYNSRGRQRLEVLPVGTRRCLSSSLACARIRSSSVQDDMGPGACM